MSTLRDTGTQVPRATETPNLPAGWQPPEVLTIWPENSVQDATQGVSSAKDVQIVVDAGDPNLQWRLDPEQVAERFATDFLAWDTASVIGDASSGGLRRLTISSCDPQSPCYVEYRLQLTALQAARQGPDGIWGIGSVVSDALAIDVASQDPARALPAGSAIDVELTLPEDTSANVGLAAANACSQTGSMAPDLDGGPTQLFIPDMEDTDPSCGPVGVGYAFAYATDDPSAPAVDPLEGGAVIAFPWLTVVPIYVEMIPSDPTATATATASPEDPTSPSPVDAPSQTLALDCGPTSETIVSGPVAAQSDGVHIELTSTGWPHVLFEDDPNMSVIVDGTMASLVFGLTPGIHRVGCGFAGEGEVVEYVPFEVVDPGNHWVDPALDCAEAAGAGLDAGPIAVDQMQRFASDILTEQLARDVTAVPGGYPQSADRRVFLAVVDGRVAGSVTFSRGGGTEWFPDGYSTCNVDVVF